MKRGDTGGFAVFLRRNITVGVEALPDDLGG